MEKDEFTLGDVVEITRCHAQRFSPIRLLSSWDETYKLEGLGKQKDGSYLAWDIGFSDLDNAYFTPRHGRTKVLLRMREKSYEKLCMRENDILFLFQGAGGNVGRVGFVYKQPGPSVPSSNLYHIRVRDKNIDPVWLFYRLRQPDIYNFLREKAAKLGKNISIPLTAIRALKIKFPAEWLLKSIKLSHAEMVRNTEVINDLKEKINIEEQKNHNIYIQEIDDIFAVSDKDLEAAHKRYRSYDSGGNSGF